MSVNSFDGYPLSWRPNKSALSQPYYLSLAADLEQQIRSGTLLPGTQLPPQRELADYLDLNYTTITRVYDLCRKKGLIYGVIGRGTFVAPLDTEHVTITSSDISQRCIELGSIHAFSEYSSPVENATRAVLDKGYLRRLYQYDSPLGFPHQLAAGKHWLAQFGVHTDTEHCAIFSGAQNALTVALLSLFSPGDRLAVDCYTYSNVIELARMLHLTLVPISGDNDGMLPEALEAQCRKNRIRGVYLMPSCANPTGISISESRRKALSELIRTYNLLVLEDDIAAWLYPDAPAPFFSLLPEQTVYICGMTKSLCPGLRVAFMAYGETLRRRIEYGLFNINIKTSSLDADIITELILSGEAQRIIAHKQQLTQRACSLYQNIFPEQAVNPCYYQWLHVPHMPSDIEYQLQERGIRVYSARRFAVSDSFPQEHLRVSLCSAGDMRHLEKGLTILRTYLDELK